MPYISVLKTVYVRGCGHYFVQEIYYDVMCRDLISSILLLLHYDVKSHLVHVRPLQKI